MMISKSYYIAAHIEESFRILDNLRKSRETCDIRLLASNKEISAHKVVLASGSEYFKNAIYGLVNFMYTGKVDINSENVYDIYKGADYYLIKLLKDACLDFMYEILDTENCLKIWICANNCKNEKLLTAAGNFMYSNVEITSNKKEFLNLSNDEIVEFFKRWPTKDEVFDSIITSVLKWAANKDDWEETILKILKDIPHTSISNDYFENCLTENEFIENSNGCNKWMLNISKEKFKSENIQLKSKLTESEAKLKFTKFLLDQPTIFLKHHLNGWLEFYQYKPRECAFYHFNRKYIDRSVDSFKSYKNWLYLVETDCCERFQYDDLNENGYESAFRHNHDDGLRTVILNDSMYIFGGKSNMNKCSSIHLNTNQTTNFSLLYNRNKSGVAVSDGSIYICGGSETDIVERFDPREGLTTKFGRIPFGISRFSDAVILSNKLFVSDGFDYTVMDLRNNSTWDEIETPTSGYSQHLLFSSYGKLYTVVDRVLYEYITSTTKWQDHREFTELPITYAPLVLTFE